MCRNACNAYRQAGSNLRAPSEASPRGESRRGHECEDREKRDKDSAAVALGRKGGRARAQALGKRERADIAKRAAIARWTRRIADTKVLRKDRKGRIDKAAIALRLNDKLAELLKSLTAIDRDVDHALHRSIFFGEPPDEGAANRRDAINVLTAIELFLFSQGVDSIALHKLRGDLLAVEHHGKRPAMFKPALKASRKCDTPFVQGLKGRFAGMVYAKMESGISRNQAMSWVARNIKANVARWISPKPIHASTVRQWMERYGCNLRVRRELKSVRTEEELKNFINRKTQLKEIDDNFGVLHCLVMIFTNRKRSGTEPPLKWADTFSEISKEKVG